MFVKLVLAIHLSCFGAASTQVAAHCECVPFYLCSNDTINTNGAALIDIRMSTNQCENYLDVCCKKKRVAPEMPIRTSGVNASCGNRNEDGIGFRIVGNDQNESQFGEFPWMVAVLKRITRQQTRYVGGSSLIHPSVVLTAAHIIIQRASYIIRAGEWDTTANREIFKHQDRTVKSIVIHGGYKKRTLHNDVALMFLESPVDLARHINTICLPLPDTVVSSQECFVTGWGRDGFNDGSYQTILKKIEVPMVDRARCQAVLRETRLGRNFGLHTSFVCAGGREGKDACTGDGGGPLVCPIPGNVERYQQVGIVAGGIGCGNEGTPGIYVDVAHFRDWINRQMRKKNF